MRSRVWPPVTTLLCCTVHHPVCPWQVSSWCLLSRCLMAGLVTPPASLLIRIRAETVSAPLPLISNEFPSPSSPSLSGCVTCLSPRSVNLNVTIGSRENRKLFVFKIHCHCCSLEGRENQVVLIPGRSFTFHCHYETKITGDGPFLRRPPSSSSYYLTIFRTAV